MLPVSELPANDIRLTGASVKRSPRRNQPSELILLGRSRSRKTGGIGLRVFQPAPGVVEDDPVVGLQKPRSQQLFERCGAGGALWGGEDALLGSHLDAGIQHFGIANRNGCAAA